MLPILAVLGCATPTLLARGRQVVPLDTEPGPECVVLGNVSGSADPFFGGLKSSEELVSMARIEALNDAGALGATHLRFVGAPERWPSGTFGGGQGVSVAGIAYRCVGAGADPARAPGAPSPR